MIKKLLFIALILWLGGFAVFALTLPSPQGEIKTDAVVVLTGSAGRIERGMAVLEKQWAGRLLISGVDRTVKPQELSAHYNMSEALFACCVDLGFRSVDTHSNGQETARWVLSRKLTSLRLVTSDWHMRRAHFELERALKDNDLNDVVIIDDPVPGNASYSLLFKEYNKFVYRWIGRYFGY